MIDALRALRLTAEDFVVRLSSRDAWQAFFARRCPDAGRACEFCQVIDNLVRCPRFARDSAPLSPLLRRRARERPARARSR